MNWIKRGFHFLGGIYFAIILIGSVAAVVIAGTLLESYTDSHLYAAEWTYHHPLFSLLLWLLFINILFAALRRWPFKIRHIPFLITHLGLLMVIGGTIIKQRYGIQGHLNVWEGSASQSLIVPHTYALQIEKMHPSSLTALQSNDAIALGGRQVYQPSLFPELKVNILGHAPHVKEQWETWIKGQQAFFAGLPPLPVQAWDKESPFPKGVFTSLPASRHKNWLLLAVRTADAQAAMQEFYLENLTLRLSSKANPDMVKEIPLKELLESGTEWEGRQLQAQLRLTYSSIDGFDSPRLTIKWQNRQGLDKNVWIDLQGSGSLYVHSNAASWTASPPFWVDLIRPAPSLLLLEDDQKDECLFAFDEHGRVHGESFRRGHLQSLLAYEQGYAGYAIQAIIPAPLFPTSREAKEKADCHFLSQQLEQALQTRAQLAPPLELFKKACHSSQVDFVAHLVEFLTLWDRGHSPLFSTLSFSSPSLKQALSNLDWTETADLEQKACQWICLLFKQLDTSIQTDEDIFAFLQQRRWPFVQELNGQETNGQPSDLLTRLAQQVFSVSQYLPNQQEDKPFSLLQQAQLLSAYLKAYGIDYQTLLTRPEGESETFERLLAYWQDSSSFSDQDLSNPFMTLETPLTLYHRSEAPLQKREDNRPALFLEVQEGSRKQLLSLAYDPTAMGLKWPILNGHYLIRFQPKKIELPYRLRLRQARQINYPHTQQPYSYEGDLLITDSAKKEIEKTLSMNRVHETWDGYRFYLAGMNASSDQAAKRVQLIINKDPAKYWLTYPGALIVTLGIILLFWLRPYRKQSK